MNSSVRLLLRVLGAAALVSGVAVGMLTAGVRQPAGPPNILLIHADDQEVFRGSLPLSAVTIK